MSMTVNGMTVEQIRNELGHRNCRRVSKETGVHFVTISRIKTGVSPNPRIESLDALSRYFLDNPVKESV